MKVPASFPLFALVAVAALAAAWAITRQGAASAAGQAAGQALVDATDGAIRGTVVGIGGIVGIPDTNADQCTIDLANGDMWAASFSCPAPRYLKALAGNIAGSGGATGSY